jgi:circadian clock protein KaiC
MSLETPQLFGISTISDHGISHLSDDAILRQFVRDQARLQRAITVVKARASSHEPGGPRIQDRAGRHRAR